MRFLRRYYVRIKNYFLMRRLIKIHSEEIRKEIDAEIIRKIIEEHKKQSPTG